MYSMVGDLLQEGQTFDNEMVYKVRANIHPAHGE
jgi:hypothetical protein